MNIGECRIQLSICKRQMINQRLLFRPCLVHFDRSISVSPSNNWVLEFSLTGAPTKIEQWIRILYNLMMMMLLLFFFFSWLLLSFFWSLCWFAVCSVCLSWNVSGVDVSVQTPQVARGLEWGAPGWGWLRSHGGRRSGRQRRRRWAHGSAWRRLLANKP